MKRQKIFVARPPPHLKNFSLNDEQIKILKNPNKKWIEQSLQWITERDQHIIIYPDLHYPALLKEISQAPVVLFVKGDKNLLLQPQIAMVGSRNPSHTGLEMAFEFARAFAKAGLCVTSGMAIGIDGASHEGALHGNGKTIAVLGSGLYHIYPKRHQTLALKIAAQGALVSEFPLQISPEARNFPRRNRIISGLSVGTLVVEAALKSGSLITTQYALEQNRDVFAIPGSPRNAMATGCLSLIQQGAKCVMSAQDVLNELSGVELTTEDFPFIQSVKSSVPLDRAEQQVLACIDDTATTVDQICARCKLPAPLVSTILLQLELKNVLRRYFGGYERLE